MVLKIKNMTISNFKGVSQYSLTFGERTEITGANGTGKTTIADAWYWLMTGKDSVLTDNPNVVPIGVTEANPTVYAECDIDGKPVSIRKVQTYKNKDGKETTSNQYFVNEVPMTERDYKAKLESYGIDFDKMLVLSHPDYLLRDTSKKGREYVRNEILFPMSQKATDKEIADINKLTDLVSQLNDYDLGEIEKMQKATLARINKEIGKDNTVANARIDELTRSKKGLSVQAVKKQIDELQAKINNNQQAQKDTAEKVSKLQQGILQMKFDRNAIVTAQNDERGEKRYNTFRSLSELREAVKKANNAVSDNNLHIQVKQSTITAAESRIKFLEKEIEKIKADNKIMDCCPTCGQKLPKERLEEIKKDFEDGKEFEINRFTDEIAEQKEICEIKKSEIAILYADNDSASKIAHKFEQEIKDLEAQLEELETCAPELPTQALYLDNKISEANHEIEVLQDNNLKEVERNLLGQMATLQNEHAKAFQDEMIDKRIADIRDEIKQAEINRAKAEKLIYQIEQLNKAKNSMLEQSINDHFSIVKWKLFKTLKNGNIEDACTPIVDGYEFGTSTNKGREILAKIDIINSLSTYYDQIFPVFLDNAENLSAQTEARLNLVGQLVEFKVTDTERLNYL